MKKLLSYLLVIALVLVQFMPLVSAAEVDSDLNNPNKGSIQAGDTGTINITNTLKGKTYTIYQVLELESFDDERKAYTYNAASTEWNTFLTTVGVDYLSYDDVKGVWTWKDGADAQEFAKKALVYAETNRIAPAKDPQTAANDGDTITFSGLELGYYLVDSTAGALCNLTTTHLVTTIKEKNAVPSVDKEVEENSTKEYGNSNTADYFEVVNFRTTINVQDGAENYVLVDVMSAGLKLNETFILKHADGTTVPKSAYKIYTTGDKLNVNFDNKAAVATFVIEFDNEYMASLKNETEEGDTQIDERDIIVEYSAIVTKDAVVELEGNPNETWLEYGDNNESNKDITRTYTLSFDVVKTDAQGKDLTGAEFELYSAQTGGEPIALVKVSDGVYRIASAEEKAADNFVSAILEAGKFMIQGLDADTYYLEETKAPEGYNKLSSRIKVEVGTSMNDTTINAVVNGTNDQIVTYENDDVKIKNFTGSLLPSTGGMGTVMFITVGSIMVLGFGVLLVTKLRISKMEI